MSRPRTASTGTTKPIHHEVTRGPGLDASGVAKECPGPSSGRSKWQATATVGAEQYRLLPAPSSSARVSTADHRAQRGAGPYLVRGWRTTTGRGTVRFAAVPQREDDTTVRFGILIASPFQGS